MSNKEIEKTSELNISYVSDFMAKRYYEEAISTAIEMLTYHYPVHIAEYLTNAAEIINSVRQGSTLGLASSKAITSPQVEVWQRVL